MDNLLRTEIDTEILIASGNIFLDGVGVSEILETKHLLKKGVKIRDISYKLGMTQKKLKDAIKKFENESGIDILIKKRRKAKDRNEDY
jgi:DNA-binding MarR family transcriptional regulator